MLNHPTLDQLRALKFDGMAEAFVELQTQDGTGSLSHAEWLGLLVDRETATFAFAIVLIVFASSRWDKRTQWQAEFVEANILVDPKLSDYLGNDLVYWEGGITVLWLKLQRPSYFSCTQSAANIMQRDLAVEWARRGSVLRTLNTADMRLKKHNWCPVKSGVAIEGPQSVKQLRNVCTALPDIDVLALRIPVPDARAFVWKLPVSRPVLMLDLPVDDQIDPPVDQIRYRAGTIHKLYFYRCRDILKG